MKNILPVLVLKNLLILPNQEVKIELSNNLSKEIINLSKTKYKNELIVLAPKEKLEEIPDIEDLGSFFVVVKIKNQIELPNGNLRITLRGLFRAKKEVFSNDSYNNNILKCKYKKLEIPKFNEEEAEAIKRKLIALLKKYVNNSDKMSNSILNLIKDVNDLNKLTDMIAAFLPLTFEKKLIYIEEINPLKRGINLMEDLHFELEVIKLDKKLEDRLRTRLDNNQKEFILKEKLEEIEEELGTKNKKSNQINDYLKRLNDLKIKNPKIVNKIKEEINKYELMSETSPEVSNVSNYIEWMLSLPWNKSSEEEMDLKTIKKNLDKTHFGMEDVKNKILEYIVAKKESKDLASPIICLVGPPGVGKTTLAKSISNSLNRQFYKISVGGLNDSSILNGHKRTYLSSSPGKIIEALKRTGTNNPVILIDEVDKMVSDYKGNPSGVLLDILDKKQNKEFIDNYIEEPFDLSNIFFILTANYKENIPYELIDRLEIIELSSYTALEKLEITKKYIMPKICKEHNLAIKDFKFTSSAYLEVINNYTYEAGLRNLRRLLTTIIRRLLLDGKKENIKIDKEMIKTILGPSKYQNNLIKDKISGLVNALAVTNVGGKVLQVETSLYEGSGKLKITGNLEQVMKESIDVSLSYIKSNLKYFELEKISDNLDLHIHFLEAAVKKDGPSSGLAVTTSILSKIKNKPINSNISMTGEITLNGVIKTVGGIKEKLIGAYNNNITTVFIPKTNHPDLEKVPVEVLEKIKIIEVENYKEIYNILFR